MFANEFDYHRAETVEEAIELLETHPGAEPLAGTHGLLPRMKTGEEAPPTLVDISHVDGLGAIEVGGADGGDDADGGGGDVLSVGALATHATIAESETVRRHAPALAEAAAAVGDLQVRAGGTIGGNLAHGDARVDPAAAALALDASIVVRGPDGTRRIAATELFEGSFETAIGDGEILTRVEVPLAADAVSAYHKRRNPLSGYATVGVAARVVVADDHVTNARIGATAVASAPTRLPAVEEAITGEPVSEATIETAAGRAGESIPSDEVRSDPYASASYRRHLLQLDTESLLRELILAE